MMMLSQNKYYYDFNQMEPLVSIKQIIFAEFFEKRNKFFIIEWIEFVSYFRKLCESMEFYMVKCMIKDYYSEGLPSSRYLLRKIMENLNLYIYDVIHYEYFLTFEDSINRFNKLKILILDSQSFFTDDKKREFIEYLISSLDIFQKVITVFDDNFIYKQNLYIQDVFYNIKPIYENEWVPFAGGILNNKNIKSFFVTKSCITIYHYLKFMENHGYLEKTYWSKDGYTWLNNSKASKPTNWIFSDNLWYVNNIPIEEMYNNPVEKISYYEAEACCKFYGGRLPTEEEWIWMSTNRNKTVHPNGIDIPYFFESAINLSNIEAANNTNYESLMGLFHLYGNVWEYTSTIEIENQDINVCLKGGDYKVPNFLLNSQLKMLLDRECKKYSTGFRIVKL